MKCTPFTSVLGLESAAERNHGECVGCGLKGVMEYHAFCADGSCGSLWAKCAR